MSLEQILAIAVIGVMMAGFIWGRLRYDLVACCALMAAVAMGVVAPGDAFKGFSDDIVIIVGSALMVSAAVARSDVMEAGIRRLAPNLTSPRLQLVVLVGLVTVLSAFVKNIGALAIMLPIAFQMARRSGVSPSMFLMPMAFGSLLGGLMTEIGTSPNIIVSRMRAELTGTPFSMFDFTPVGATLSVVGICFLAVFYWLLPERQRRQSDINDAIAISNYTTEARVVEDTPADGMTVGEVQKPGEGRAMVTAIVGSSQQKRVPLPDTVISAGDILLLEGDAEALDRIVARGGLILAGGRRDTSTPPQDIGIAEAIIGQHSSLIGQTAQRSLLFDRTGLNLLAVSRRGQRFTERLSRIELRLGDIILLQGNRNRLPELLKSLDCLPLAERSLRLGSVRRGLIPVAILALAMAATATGLVPVTVAFFAAAVMMVLSHALPLREAYDSLDGPILVMLAALIPVSDSLRTTGATDVIAGWLSRAGMALPDYGALALIMVAAMAVTPFLNNAATVLVMAPIAAQFATGLGFRPEAFLMAVAIGAGCDFLTPIGHQCNTLVMGPGGYRFGDYWRLGLPLSILVILIGVPALMIVWPL